MANFLFEFDHLKYKVNLWDHLSDGYISSESVDDWCMNAFGPHKPYGNRWQHSNEIFAWEFTNEDDYVLFNLTWI